MESSLLSVPPEHDIFNAEVFWGFTWFPVFIILPKILNTMCRMTVACVPELQEILLQIKIQLFNKKIIFHFFLLGLSILLGGSTHWVVSVY